MAESEKPKKDRKWRLLLYPEDPTHVAAMKLLEEAGYNYAAILHDKDVYDGIPDDDDDESTGEIGTLKKPHWHVVLKTVNAQYPTALAKEFGIKPNYFKTCKNFDKACVYLVHGDEKDSDKFQYDVSEVFGPLAPHVAKLMQSGDEGMKVKEIVKKIDSISGRANYRELLLWACDQGLYAEFRRLGNGIGYLLREHNDDFYTALYKYESEKLSRSRFDEFEKRSGDVDWVSRCRAADKFGVPPSSMDDIVDY